MTAHRGRASRAKARPPARKHLEALPTHRLVVADTAFGVVRAIVAGCAIALALDVAVMLIATLVAPAALGAPDDGLDQIGLGVLAVAATGLLVAGLLAGVLTLPARLALASLYSGLRAGSAELRGTIVVRGQVPPSPTSAASVSAVVLGGIALLAAIPCIVLSADSLARLDDELSREQFWGWARWALVLLALAAVCAVAVAVLSSRSRTWRATVGTRLPAGALGDDGPAVRLTTRAERRAARGARSRLERWNAAGRAILAVGAVAVFFGLSVHQPALYTDWTPLEPAAERVIGVIAAFGGVLMAAGLLVGLATGMLALRQTRAALRRVEGGDEPIADVDRTRVREATGVLSRAVDTGIAWWTALAVVAAGYLLAGTGSPWLLVVPTAWVLGMLPLWAARVALERRGPELRNRFGYAVPREPDDREFPNLTVYG